MPLACGFRTFPAASLQATISTKRCVTRRKPLSSMPRASKEDGKSLPRPRTLTELKADPEVADDLKTYMVALIELPARAHAAE